MISAPQSFDSTLLTRPFTDSNFQFDSVSCKLFVCDLAHPKARYIFQRRCPKDDRKPGALSLFGGNVDPTETPLKAIWRELEVEELPGFRRTTLMPICAIGRYHPDSGRYALNLYLRANGYLDSEECGEGSVVRFTTPASALKDESFGQGPRMALAEACRKKIIIPPRTRLSLVPNA